MRAVFRFLDDLRIYSLAEFHQDSDEHCIVSNTLGTV